MIDNFFVNAIYRFLLFFVACVDYDFFIAFVAVFVVFCIVALLTKFTMGDYN